MAKVVAVSKDYDGTLVAFKLDNGQVLNLEQCINAVDNGTVSGLIVGSTINGHATVHAVRDYEESNNLSNLPLF